MFFPIQQTRGEKPMRKGGKDYRGHGGDEAYRRHGEFDNPEDKLEPVNRLSESYYDAMDDAQDLWDPGIECNDWDINTDEDDDTLT